MSKSRHIAAALLILISFGIGNGPKTAPSSTIETTTTATIVATN